MRLMLTVVWALLLALGVASGGIFVRGVIRDSHVGDPELAVDLARTSAWQRASFRVWDSSRYALSLSTVNHVPPFGLPYRGAFEVVVRAPSGEPVLQRSFAGDSMQHVRPDNMHWSALDSLALDDRPWRSWELSVRVVRADPAFAGTRSAITLRKQRYDPGMGGMANYIMIVPAGVCLLLALVVSHALWTRTGAIAPLWTSVAALAILALLLVVPRLGR
jgi:hypothetical protein